MKSFFLAVILLAAPAASRAASSFDAFLSNARAEMNGVAVDTSVYCVNDEYFQGGIFGSLVSRVNGGAARKYVLALKLVARKTDNGNIVDRLGVYDVTVAAVHRDDGLNDYCGIPVIGREFSLDLPGQMSFSFEQNNSGSSYLDLKIGEDGSVQVSSHDMPEQRVTTTRDALKAERAKELEAAPKMTVGPETFLCLVQPGPKVSLAFFPLGSDHHSAELLAEIYEGLRGLLPAPLGQVGDAPYFLDYDRKTGHVRATAGASPSTAIPTP